MASSGWRQKLASATLAAQQAAEKASAAAWESAEAVRRFGCVEVTPS